MCSSSTSLLPLGLPESRAVSSGAVAGISSPSTKGMYIHCLTKGTLYIRIIYNLHTQFVQHIMPVVYTVHLNSFAVLILTVGFSLGSTVVRLS